MAEINKHHFQLNGLNGKNYIDRPYDPFVCWKCGSEDLTIVFQKGCIGNVGNVLDDEERPRDISNYDAEYEHFFHCRNCDWQGGNCDGIGGVWCRPRSHNYRS